MSVQVFSPSPRSMQAGQIGQALGIGVNRNFPDPQMLVQRGMLQQALAKAKQQASDPNSTPLDRMFAVMEAGAGIPGSERYLSSILPEVMKLSQAQAAQNAPFGIQDQLDQARTPEARQTFLSETPSFQRQPMPEFGQLQSQLGQGQFFPSIQPGSEAPGNLPQAATSGIKQPVLSNNELVKRSKPLAAQMTKAGIPTTPSQAYEILKQQNEDTKDSNKLVEQERQERVTQQRDYGVLGENAIRQVLPNATPEQVAMFKRKGEEFAGKNQSEADIERKLAGEARIFKNMISKIENSIEPPRLLNTPIQKLGGNFRDLEKRKDDARIKVAPLLKEGLYDTARNLLSKKGYYPEEREDIVSKLGEGADKVVSQMPRIWEQKPVTALDMARGKFTPDKPTYTTQQANTFKENLSNTLKNDPSANLILLRRKYEDEKGVDWELFKDSLNEIINNGEFSPNPDQFNQLNTLEQPRLDLLDEILYKVGMKGL